MSIINTGIYWFVIKGVVMSGEDIVEMRNGVNELQTLLNTYDDEVNKLHHTAKESVQDTKIEYEKALAKPFKNFILHRLYDIKPEGFKEYNAALKEEIRLYLEKERYDALKHELEIAKLALSLAQKNETDKETADSDDRTVYDDKKITEYNAECEKKKNIIKKALARGNAIVNVDARDQLRTANAGFVEGVNTTDRIQTRFVPNVTVALKDRAVMVLAELGTASIQTEEESGFIVTTPTNDTAPVFYRNVHLDKDDIIEARGKLSQGGSLYLAKDSMGKVTNRTELDSGTLIVLESDADKEAKNKAECKAREDAIEAAFEHARLALDGYNEKSGTIVITAQGSFKGIDKETRMNMIYAALLVLGKDMKYLKIRSDNTLVGPKPGYLYGYEKAGFIKDQLGKSVNNHVNKNQQKDFSDLMKARRNAEVKLDAGKEFDDGSSFEIKRTP